MAKSSGSGATEIDNQLANLNTSSRISDKNEASDKNDSGNKEIDSDKLDSCKNSTSNNGDNKKGDKKFSSGDKDIKEPHPISNGKTEDEKKPADSGDNKEGDGDSPPKDNNNNKNVSVEQKTAEKTTVDSGPETGAAAGKGHAPLTTSHSQLSATAAPFIEGLNSVNYKSAKPRPLKMPHNPNVPFSPGHTQLSYAHQYLGPQHHFTSGYHGQSHQSNQQQNNSQSSDTLSTDEALEIMENINRAVKANQFSQILSGQIFRLYNFLKTNGETLEQTNKNELNRVFVSLRQACCRDSGQLGTPCRLKMMELVELRAMGWRPSLSHSQYYLNRAANGVQQQQTGGAGSAASSNAPNTPSQDMQSLLGGEGVSSGEMERLGAAPVSAPPYGHMALNPFSFNLPAPGPPPDIMPNPSLAGPAPSYYLIPATHIGHPPAGLTFVGHSAGGGPGLLPPPPPPMLHHPLTSTFSTPAGLPSMTPSSSDFPKGAVTKSSSKFNRPTKIPGKNQFRDEVVIRNADSGKIMGVKGRRVSIIEEISKTIVSFQKVMQGAKERTLTITGPNEESIFQAKILIEDTIRRNVSPAREGEGELPLRHDLDGMSNHSEESDLAGTGENGEQSTETECALAEMGSILKLSCANPAVLQVARRALNEYFHRHEPLRRSSTADAYRYMGGGVSYGKERRKSMPLPLHALSNVAESAEFETLTPKTPVDKDAPGSENGSLTNISKLNRSTPNLAAGERRSILKPLRSFTFDDKPTVFDENRPRVVYTREFLLQCAGHDVSKTKPNILPAIAEQISEIVAPGPDKFDPVIYKRRCSDLKQVRF